MQTIIFDVDDTMYDQALSFHRTFQNLFDEKLTYDELDKLYRSSRKHSEILFDKSEAGEITELEWQTGRITAACNEFGIPINEKKALAFHEMYVAEQQKITLFPEMEELLEKLAGQGRQLGVLTNGEEGHQAMKIKQLEIGRWIPEMSIFISGSYGHAKPKREIFEIVEQRLGLDKANTVYIGDSFEKDIVGAKQAGWQAIWMNHRKRNLPADTAFKPDKEVYSAGELLELFA